MADIFISYAREDSDIAARLAGVFQDRGYSVWWDRNMPVGRSFSDVIDSELDSAACVVVLWSPTSVRSDWVLAEAAEGAARKILIPIQIGSSRLPLEFRRLHAASLDGWSGGTDHHGIKGCIDAVANVVGRIRNESTSAPHATAESFRTHGGDYPRSSMGAGSPSNSDAPLPSSLALIDNLLWIIVVVLIILWLLGFVAFPVGGNLIHIILLMALILVIYRLATRRRVL